METPLITSETALAERQAKINHVVNVLLSPVFAKLNISAEDWQDGVVENGGTFQDQVVEVVKKLIKKARGIVTPVRAEDTGLVPSGCSVYVTKDGVRKDRLEGDVDLAKVEYVCPLREGDGDYISGEVMLQRSVKLKAIGSLGYAFALLKAQEEGKEIFPVESRGQEYFLMPLTELLDGIRRRFVAYFIWHAKSQRWVLDFNWVGRRYRRNARFVRHCE